MADFCLVAKRVLEDPDHQVFRCHFLLGADWRLCCRQLGIDRGTVFHAIYRIEQRLGRAFAEIVPYPLYPLSDYFSGYGGGPSGLVSDVPGGRHVQQIFADRIFGPSKRDEAQDAPAAAVESEKVMYAGAEPAA